MDPTQLQSAIDFAAKNPNDPRSQELQNRIQSGQFNDTLKSMGKDTSRYGVQPTTQPQQQQGVFKAGPILGQKGADILNSATHGLQMVGQDIGQGIMGKQNQDTIQSYATNAQTLSQLAAKQNDPALKQKYANMATQMLQDGKQAGLDLKGRTPEQIVGDILEAGTESAAAISLGLGGVGLAGAGSTAEATGGQVAKTFGQKFLQHGIEGAKIGAGFNAASGVATGLQNQGNTEQVIGEGIKGGLVGGALGFGIGGVAGVAPELMQGAKELPGNIKNTLTGTSTKSAEEILATPEKDLWKLKPSEVDTWLQSKQLNNLEQTQQSAVDLQKLKDEKISAINEKTKVETDKIISQQKDLQEKLNNSSAEKAKTMKPDIIQGMKDESAIYRQKIEKGMDGKEGLPIQREELAKFIDENSKDADTAARLKIKLGVDTPTGETTLGDLYNKTKELKQDLSASGTRGTRTFTASDVETDKAIKKLTEFMKTKGVDFSEANKFWSQYAGIRDNIVNKFNPFDASNADVTRGANFINKVASGESVNFQPTVDKLEKWTGGKLAPQQEKILSQMDDLKLAKIQKEADAVNRIKNLDINDIQIREGEVSNQQEKLLRDQTIKEIRDSVNNKVRLKKVIIGAIISAGGLLGLKRMGIDIVGGLIKIL